MRLIRLNFFTVTLVGICVLLALVVYRQTSLKRHHRHIEQQKTEVNHDSILLTFQSGFQSSDKPVLRPKPAPARSVEPKEPRVTASNSVPEDREEPMAEMTGWTVEKETRTLYEVRPGDTFEKISEYFYGKKKYFQRLVDANPALDPKRLRPGMTVYVPDVQTGDAPKSSVPDSSVLPEVRAYRIKSGDTLSEVVERELGTIKKLDEVLRLNPGLDSSKLKVDQVIYLPVKPAPF